MERFTVKGVTFDSPFTDAQALAICDTLTSNFAKDLVRASKQYRRGLTLNQRGWVHKLAMEAQQPKPAPVTVALDPTGILALFNRANQKLKRPKVLLSLPDGQDIQLSLAGSGGRYPGSINVTNGVRYGEPGSVFFGRIHAEGRFEAYRAATPEVIAFLQEFAEKPAAVAAQYGHRTGHCCFCNLKLEDERSTAVGYGPVCAKNYGLPWGVEAANVAEAERLEALRASDEERAAILDAAADWDAEESDRDTLAFLRS